MAIRVEYWEVPAGNIKEALKRDFEPFQNWYLELADEYPSNVHADILELLLQISTPEELFETEKAKIMDELTSIYLGEFCDDGPGKLRPIKNASFLRLSNYEREFSLLKARCSKSVAILWKHVLQGRSISDLPILNISDDAYWFCFLSENECQLLLDQLSTNFLIKTPDEFNTSPAIGSMIQAIQNKKGPGMLITVV